MSRPGIEELDADRAILIDCKDHSDADCDAAARRLLLSPRHSDVSIAREWRTMREREDKMRRLGGMLLERGDF
jgi:hypothetical protein